MFQFIEKFQEIKEATRHAPAGSASNGTSSTPTTSTNASPVIARAVKMDQVRPGWRLGTARERDGIGRGCVCVGQSGGLDANMELTRSG